jgi:integrase
VPQHLYRRGKVWWLRVTIAGREHRRSLRTPVRKLAAERAKAELERLQRADWGDERRTWKEAVVRWHAEVALAALRPATLRRYLSSLKVAGDVLAPLHLDEIDRKVLARIAGRPGITNATRRRDLTAVSAVLQAAVGWEWLQANPARAFDRGLIRERRDPIVLPTDNQVEQLHRSLPARLRPLVRLLEQTGLRLEEAASLSWRQVDLHRAALQVERSKTGRARSVPLSPAAAGTLHGTPRRLGCAWVFWHPTRDGGADRYHNLASYLHQLRKAAGVPFRTHDLRHLFAVRYLRDGGSIYALQQILGHSTIATTELYLDFLTPEEAVTAKRLAAGA